MASKRIRRTKLDVAFDQCGKGLPVIRQYLMGRPMSPETTALMMAIINLNAIINLCAKEGI